MSGEQMQAKIAAARREAEGLKDKIKRRKDELADTTRTVSHFRFLIDVRRDESGQWGFTASRSDRRVFTGEGASFILE